MYCSNCGSEMTGGSAYCGVCGQRLRPKASQPDAGAAGRDPSPVGRQEHKRPEEAYTRPGAGVGMPGRPNTDKAPPSEGSSKPPVMTAFLGLALLAAALLLMLLLFKLISPAEKDEVTAPAYDSSESAQTGPSAAPISESPAPGNAGFAAPISPAPVTPAPATPAPVTPAPTAAGLPGSYDSEYILPESNTRYLTTTDLQGLSQLQCCLARNEIYARHHRIFAKEGIADYFNSQSWYSGTVPGSSFNAGVLNDYERENIIFIKQYEDDTWGGAYY